MIYINITVQIHYITDFGNKVLQRGSFPSKGRCPAKVAFDWWRELKREMNLKIEIEKVIVDGEDFTQIINELEKKVLHHRNLMGKVE